MKLFFSGDVLLKDESYTGNLVCEQLQKVIEESDIVCCNLEGPCIKDNAVALKKRGPSLFQGEQTLQRLKKSGFNTLILANNHIMDFGIEGLRTTLGNMDNNFYCAGAAEKEKDVYKVLEIESQGKIIGIISITECVFGSSINSEGGCAWMGHERVSDMFAIAREQCDYIFVVCHCGAEELEVPLPEVKKIYKSFIAQGATAVIGHHPHVVQGYEEYKGKKIFYSLGNFAFDRLDDPKLAYQPIGVSILVDIGEDGLIQYKPIFTEYVKGQVGISIQNEKWNKVNSLLRNKSNYKKAVDNYCIIMFEKYFKRYIAAVVGLDAEDRDKCEKFAKYRLAGKPLRWDYLFLYHNIAIETNRWICLHAIKALGYLE